MNTPASAALLSTDLMTEAQAAIELDTTVGT